ncbi:MAG: hypothetical protein R3E77_12005 [Steroidobacteraceae bacterium]
MSLLMHRTWPVTLAALCLSAAHAVAQTPAPEPTAATAEPASGSSPADKTDATAKDATEDLQPAVDTSSATTATPTPAPAGARGGRGIDRLDLDTTQITGNRELPKVLYIVPWKRSDLGDLLGKPVNSLLDEVLQPVDRDVFRRENRYYEAVKPDAAQGSGSPAGKPEN